LFKHEPGRTIVFVKHGACRTIESYSKFQNSSLFIGIFRLIVIIIVILSQKYLLAIGLHSFKAHLQRDKDLQRDEMPLQQSGNLFIISLNNGPRAAKL